MRRAWKALSGLEGPLENSESWDDEISAATGTHSTSWRDRVPDYRSCNAEAAGAIIKREQRIQINVRSLMNE